MNYLRTPDHDFAPEQDTDALHQARNEIFNEDPEVQEALTDWLQGALSDIGLAERMVYLRERAMSRAQDELSDREAVECA